MFSTAMFTYRYQCAECALEWELRRAHTERDAPAVCPACRKPTGKRVFTPTRNLFYPPFTGQYTAGELARAIAPDTPEERAVWDKYG